MADLTVLDIGHGNCAVLRDGQGTVIIDAGGGQTLLEFLEARGIVDIDAVLLSHGDADHIGGVLLLLAQRHITVHSIYLNADAARRTGLWKAFLVALADARTRRDTRVRTQLTTESTTEFGRGDVHLEILAPTPEVAASGVGGRDLHDRQLTANSASAVIRVLSNGIPEVLLSGDIDGTGLTNLLSEYPEPRARVLVFPHHGGRPGVADPFQFATDLCRAVEPDVVIFSIGRGKHNTPLPDIVRGVRAAVPRAHIACTQLSGWCAATVPATLPEHLDDRPARGRLTRSCCAGTFEMSLGNSSPDYQPRIAMHRAFVEREAPTALCLGRGVLAVRVSTESRESKS